MAGGVYGADIGQLRALAVQLERSADEIESAGRLLTQGITTNTQWQGPDAVGFRSEWSGAHHQRIAAAVAALRAGAHAVRANADQQEAASAADGGSAVGGLGFALSGSGATGHLETLPGRFRPEGVTPYGLRELLDHPFMGATEGVSLTWEQVIGFIPKVGTASGAVILAEQFMDPSVSNWNKILSTADLAAGELRSYGPVPYAVGVAISTWVDVFEAAQEADFSASGLQMVVDEIARDPWGSLVSASESVVSSLGDLVDNFTFW